MPWDFNSSIPIYLQIESMIKARIFSGEYPPGSHIPSVREIAQELAVNPNTVQKAFKDLEDSKLILTMRTSGRLVTEDIRTITQARQKDADGSVKSFLSEMGKMGFSPEDVLAALKAICEAAGFVRQNPQASLGKFLGRVGARILFTGKFPLPGAFPLPPGVWRV